MVNTYDSTSIFSHVGIILLFIYDRDPHILSPLEHRKNQREDSHPVKGTTSITRPALDQYIQH